MRNLLIMILILSCFGLESFSQATVGTRVTSAIVPNDSLDNIYTHDDYFGRGGYRTVSTITLRNSIYTNRRKEGMLVKVLSDGKIYELKGGITNDKWVELVIGGSGGADTLTRVIIKPKIAPTYLVQALDTAGHNRFAATHNGLIIGGRGHQGPISVDGLVLLGSNSSLESKNGISLGRWINNRRDSTSMLGVYLDATHPNTFTLGQGISPSQKLTNTRPNSMGIGYGQTTPQIELTTDTTRINGILLHNNLPISGGGGGITLRSGFFKSIGDSTLGPWASLAELGGNPGFYFGSNNPTGASRLNLNGALWVRHLYSSTNSNHGIYGESSAGSKAGIRGHASAILNSIGGHFTSIHGPGGKFESDNANNIIESYVGPGKPAKNFYAGINATDTTYIVDKYGLIKSKYYTGLTNRYLGASTTGDIIVMPDPTPPDMANYYTKTELGASGSSTVHFNNITSTPTTLSGYGITDAASSSHSHTFASITSKPTTLSGYGITDAATSSHIHAVATTTANGLMAKEDKAKLNKVYTDLRTRTQKLIISTPMAGGTPDKLFDLTLNNQSIQGYAITLRACKILDVTVHTVSKGTTEMRVEAKIGSKIYIASQLMSDFQFYNGYRTDHIAPLIPTYDVLNINFWPSGIHTWSALGEYEYQEYWVYITYIPYITEEEGGVTNLVIN